MKKSFFLVFTFVLLAFAGAAQVKSPEAFLGYKIGARYTPHWKLVDYFKHVAAEVPSMVVLQQYGESNEHRPLYLAFIGNSANISRLEDIRRNNLQLADQRDNNAAANAKSPAIVWLSYNVHGNETSSSEAAMMTLFALVDPANTSTKAWLQNTLVIMDPCLNPDGRERYINWYQSVIGDRINPRPNAREHVEPWPGGRSNHYYFDLNRDWAWQTQLESQQRLKEYNRWLPQVHVDFHEQGIDNPYYFAPAAQPYHEVITAWQRDFQKTIGKNHAKYFDRNGWLYFTNERFDLLYPSYGDTYPIYNGSIGMTYEQGGIRAGLGIITAEGDTLTLTERVLHHYTTSLSTVETASQHADELVNEFKKFFNPATAPAYKSYVIINKPQDRERIGALLQFLEKNNIQYGSGSGEGKGYDYQTGKTASFSVKAGDIVISGTQPKAALVKVLFDPNPRLTDTITYDITSWALPYAYGVTAYASPSAINISSKGTTAQPLQNTANDTYGYIVNWQGMPSARVLSQLLQAGVRVRHAEIPLVVEGKNFPAGSLIILKRGNEKFGQGLWQTVAGICNKNQVMMHEVRSGMVEKGVDFGSSKVIATDAPNAVLLTGRQTSSTAVGDVWHFMDRDLQYPVTLMDAENIAQANWNSFDVLILADGYYSFLNDPAFSDRLAEWLRNGGKLIAMEGAVAQVARQKWSTLKARDNDPKKDSAANKDPYAALKAYDNREREDVQQSTPGSVLKVDVDPTHPLMFGYSKTYYTLKMDNALYEFIKDNGWNAGVIKKESQLSGYVGYKLRKKLNDGLVFGVQDLGRGSVVYLTDNVLFRNFWENGKLIFCNALFNCKVYRKPY